MGNLRGLSQPHHRAAERAVRLSEALAWWFASGHAADLILAVLAAEWLWLGRRWGWAAATWRLLPGAMMIVALRLALVGADWWWIALALGSSFPPHLIDVSRGRHEPR